MARNECFWASSQFLSSQSLFDHLVGLGHCMLLVVSSHSGFMFLPVHHCCGRSRLGGHAGQFCAITALARHLFCGNALQGKGFASAESATCSTFMFAPFFFCFAHSWRYLLLLHRCRSQEMNACLSCTSCDLSTLASVFEGDVFYLWFCRLLYRIL